LIFKPHFSAPISEPWPDHFCLEGVVLHFGIKGTSDKELMPPPKSCIVPKDRRKINTVESHDEIIGKTEDGESRSYPSMFGINPAQAPRRGSDSGLSTGM